jgi:hypothetical protein
MEFTDKAKPKNMEKRAKIKKKKFESTFFNYP